MHSTDRQEWTVSGSRYCPPGHPEVTLQRLFTSPFFFHRRFLRCFECTQVSVNNFSERARSPYFFPVMPRLDRGIQVHDSYENLDYPSRLRMTMPWQASGKSGNDKELSRSEATTYPLRYQQKKYFILHTSYFILFFLLFPAPAPASAGAFPLTPAPGPGLRAANERTVLSPDRVWPHPESPPRDPP